MKNPYEIPYNPTKPAFFPIFSRWPRGRRPPQVPRRRPGRKKSWGKQGRNMRELWGNIGQNDETPRL